MHACWQIDTQERVDLPGYRLVHFLDVTDYANGLKIGSYLFPARCRGKLCKVSQPQYAEAIRQAITRWGLPDRIRTDHDRVLVAEGDYPFPSAFTLWLVGLGIEHELIQRATQNGSVERTHRTRSDRLEGYGPYSKTASALRTLPISLLLKPPIVNWLGIIKISSHKIVDIWIFSGLI